MSYVTGMQSSMAHWQAPNHVMGSTFLRPDIQTMSVYTDTAISAALDLDRGGFLLLALLVGGDYDMVCDKHEDVSAAADIRGNQAGLQGCGIAIAHKLTRSGLGHSLLHAAQVQSLQGLSASLVAWRQQLRLELENDPHGHMGRKHVKVARSVPDDFPQERVITNYVRPVTSWPVSDNAIPSASATWVLRQPNLPQLGLLCERYFTWATGAAILQRFNSIGMWRGTCLRLLLVCVPLVCVRAAVSHSQSRVTERRMVLLTRWRRSLCGFAGQGKTLHRQGVY